MSESNTQMADGQTPNDVSPDWGGNAPRGGKTVVTRALKDGAKVPLFLGQTLIRSLRDLGYNNTTSALCEHVDNAIQWGATEVRVYFRQTGKQPNQRIDILVYDNGKGMAPHVLKVAMAFGGSMVFDNRTGIGRYGVGMKTAALNIARSVDVYSWQEPGAFYSMTLDVDKIGQDRNNMIELPDPEMSDTLPSEIAGMFTKPMDSPKKGADAEDILAGDPEDLTEQLGRSGTIVYLPNCDRVITLVLQGAECFESAALVELQPVVDGTRTDAEEFRDLFWRASLAQPQQGGEAVAAGEPALEEQAEPSKRPAAGRETPTAAAGRRS